MIQRFSRSMWWGVVALGALILLMHPRLVAAEISKEEAVTKVIEQVVLPSPNREVLRAHFWPHPLRPGDVVTVFRPDGQRWAIERPTWLFWIDDVPTALFGHPTRFVFVDVATGTVTVHQADSWPAISGETLWGFVDEREDPRFIVYPPQRPEGSAK